MRESLARALGSSLEWDDSDHERAIDKVTAFSYAPRLGTLLLRCKDHNCARSYKPAVYLLAVKLKPLSKNISIRIAEQAMHEWLFPFCLACLGTSEVTSDGLRVPCGCCSGTGVRRYDDDERKHAIGAHVPQHIKTIHDIIGDHARAAEAVMRDKLGR